MTQSIANTLMDALRKFFLIEPNSAPIGATAQSPDGAHTAWSGLIVTAHSALVWAGIDPKHIEVVSGTDIKIPYNGPQDGPVCACRRKPGNNHVALLVKGRYVFDVTMREYGASHDPVIATTLEEWQQWFESYEIVKDHELEWDDSINFNTMGQANLFMDDLWCQYVSNHPYTCKEADRLLKLQYYREEEMGDTPSVDRWGPVNLDNTVRALVKNVKENSEDFVPSGVIILGTNMRPFVCAVAKRNRKPVDPDTIITHEEFIELVRSYYATRIYDPVGAKWTMDKVSTYAEYHFLDEVVPCDRVGYLPVVYVYVDKNGGEHITHSWVTLPNAPHVTTSIQ